MEKTHFPYIFAFYPVNSCLDTLHIVYIFRQESRSLAAERDAFITIRQRYPQTHRLWIKYPVDEQNRAASDFFRGQGKLCTDCPQIFITYLYQVSECIEVNSRLAVLSHPRESTKERPGCQTSQHGLTPRTPFSLWLCEGEAVLLHMGLAGAYSSSMIYLFVGAALPCTASCRWWSSSVCIGA